MNHGGRHLRRQVTVVLAKSPLQDTSSPEGSPVLDSDTHPLFCRGNSVLHRGQRHDQSLVGHAHSASPNPCGNGQPGQPAWNLERHSGLLAYLLFNSYLRKASRHICFGLLPLCECLPYALKLPVQISTATISFKQYCERNSDTPEPINYRVQYR